MVLNKVVDQYTLELQQSSSISQTTVRAIATNTTTGISSEELLSMERVRAILVHAYGDEEHVKNHLDSLNDGRLVKLMARSEKTCIFTPPELVDFGFNPEEL